MAIKKVTSKIDPAIKTREIKTELVFNEMPEHTLMGFHMEAITGSIGDKPGDKFALHHNFGMGGMHLYFQFKGKTYVGSCKGIMEQLIKANTKDDE